MLLNPDSWKSNNQEACRQYFKTGFVDLIVPVDAAKLALHTAVVWLTLLFRGGIKYLFLEF
jgi:hypothetical protein